MANHADLTGSDLHEPKGVSGATSGQVYVADGAGSGAWGSLPVANISGLNNANKYYIRATIADISTAASTFVPCPVAGTISKVISVLQGPITVADGTFRLRIGGTPVTDSDVTIAQSGSAAGDVDTASPTAANTVTADSAIEVQSLGTSTDAAAVEVLIVIAGS